MSTKQGLLGKVNSNALRDGHIGQQHKLQLFKSVFDIAQV